MNCFTATISLTLASKLKQLLQEQGFELSTPPYSVFSGKKKGVSCTLYESGKLTVQGKAKDEFIEFYLEPEILQDFRYSHREAYIDQTERIGVDEAGKGDFFGPLCIAAVHAKGEKINKLLKLGVGDSKKISDTKVLQLAKKIRENFIHSEIRLFPHKYNELYERFKNLNKLLGWAHAAVIENVHIKSGCNHALIDQFASESVVENALGKKNLPIQLHQRHRGEEDLVVAAGSILARACFLEGLRELGEKFDITLPKGASKKVVDMGKKIVLQFGPEILEQVAKMHFKTKEDVLN